MFFTRRFSKRELFDVCSEGFVNLGKFGDIDLIEVRAGMLCGVL